MKDLNKLPYAEWLEQSLQHIVGKQVQSICIVTKYAEPNDPNPEPFIETSYWNTGLGDKLVFAGFLQQDAMLDTLKINSYIPDDEDDDCEEDAIDG